MTTRTFLLGLTAAFGLPWLLLVVVPYGQTKALVPKPLDPDGIEVYPPPNGGLVLAGQRVFNDQGCYNCHTQVIRPTYAGPDRWRDGWAGDPMALRETEPMDYLGQPYAPLGRERIGPDLANIGFRMTDARWHYQHLYNPRSVVSWSVMPSFAHLFERRRVDGQPGVLAVAGASVADGCEAVPGDDARTLVAYLLGLRKDAPNRAPASP